MILAFPCLVSPTWHANARITRQPQARVARPNAVKIKIKDNFDPQLTYRLHRRSRISRPSDSGHSDGKPSDHQWLVSEMESGPNLGLRRMMVMMPTSKACLSFFLSDNADIQASGGRCYGTCAWDCLSNLNAVS